MTQWEPPGPEPGLKGVSSVREPSRTERAVGRRSAEARATVPDMELLADVDAAPALQAAGACGCSLTAVLVAACAGALREHPRANAGYRDGRYELYSRVNIAVTVLTEDAYVSPTILDADTKPLPVLDAELTDLGARARAGELTPPQTAGATFTLSDLGPQGVHRASALITPPQAASLTAGAVREVASVRDGAVVAGQGLSLTLACDNRILLGTAATRFLAAIVARLEAAKP